MNDPDPSPKRPAIANAGNTWGRRALSMLGVAGLLMAAFVAFAPTAAAHDCTAGPLGPTTCGDCTDARYAHNHYFDPGVGGQKVLICKSTKTCQAPATGEVPLATGDALFQARLAAEEAAAWTACLLD